MRHTFLVGACISLYYTLRFPMKNEKNKDSPWCERCYTYFHNINTIGQNLSLIILWIGPDTTQTHGKFGKVFALYHTHTPIKKKKKKVQYTYHLSHENHIYLGAFCFGLCCSMFCHIQIPWQGQQRKTNESSREYTCQTEIWGKSTFGGP